MTARAESLESKKPAFDQFTDTHCDCGTYLGSDFRGDVMKKHIAAIENKGKKKRWSSNKIQRAIKDIRESQDHKQTADISDWVRTIAEKVKTYGTLGLLLHWANGALAKSIPIKGKESISVQAVTADFLRAMKSEVLYVFTP
jgi:hypothetical protein